MQMATPATGILVSYMKTAAARFEMPLGNYNGESCGHPVDILVSLTYFPYKVGSLCFNTIISNIIHIIVNIVTFVRCYRVAIN